MKKKIILSTIGNRGHAKNIIDIAVKNKFVEFYLSYKPNANSNKKYETSNIKEILTSDVVFILSPNATHYKYLNYLHKNFKGYIFCEKPPVTKKNQLSAIKNDPYKTFFNFNLRFSNLKTFLEKINKNEKIVNINFLDCHGLAYKKNIYLSSWRSDSIRHPYGVIETMMIHYIDLSIFLFGKIQSSSYEMAISSGNGSAFDTASSNIKHKSGQLVSIFNSYAAPAKNKIEVITDNSIYEIENGLCKRSYPRDSFDKNGRFTKPSKSSKNRLSNDEWNVSLSNSVNYFLNIVLKNKKMPKKLFQNSILSNKELFKIRL